VQGAKSLSDAFKGPFTLQCLFKNFEPFISCLTLLPTRREAAVVVAVVAVAAVAVPEEALLPRSLPPVLPL
jgi:hypothetical protein